VNVGRNRNMPQRTRYERNLLSRLADSDAWPGSANPEFAERLERVAVRSLSRRTTEADVTAIVIFHQLAEQMLRVLIEDNRFFVALSVLPTPIAFREQARQTFGQVLQALRDGVEFLRKERLLTLAEDLNAIRNGVAHKLLQRGSLSGLRADAKRAHRLFDRMFAIYDDAHDDYRVTFHGIAKDVHEL
jgi:hypothetical protein